MGENEQNFKKGTNFREEGEARALYYWPYRETYERLKGLLIPGKEIPQELDVLYVGNNTLLPTYLDLKTKDRLPVDSVALPGKSAHVAFSRDMKVICGALFDRDCRRTDHAYIIRSKELMDLGFYPFSAPTPSCPLHLRVVHETHLIDPEARDIPFKVKVALVSLLQTRKIP